MNNPALLLTTASTGFDEDYQTVLDAMTVKPSEAQQIKQNQLVIDLKVAGGWGEFDFLYIMAMDGDQAAAKYNWINPAAHYLTKTGAVEPTFTTNLGMDGGSFSIKYNTNYTPSVDGVNYALNSACFGYWTQSAIGSAADSAIGLYDTTLGYYATVIGLLGGALGFSRINSPAFGTSIPGGDVAGLTVVNRDSATTQQVFLNGAEHADVTSTAGQNLPAIPFHLLGINSGEFPSFTSAKISIAFGGGNIKAVQSDVYDAFNTYMSSI